MRITFVVSLFVFNMAFCCIVLVCSLILFCSYLTCTMLRKVEQL